MATVWDLNDGFDTSVVDTQSTRVRPKTPSAGFTVIALAAGAMFCASPIPVVTAEDSWVSAPTVRVWSVPRKVSDLPKKPIRREREQYATDARDGLSTHRLAQVFDSLFTPVQEESADIEFSFG